MSCVRSPESLTSTDPASNRESTWSSRRSERVYGCSEPCSSKASGPGRPYSRLDSPASSRHVREPHTANKSQGGAGTSSLGKASIGQLAASTSSARWRCCWRFFRGLALVAFPLFLFCFYLSLGLPCFLLHYGKRSLSSGLLSFLGGSLGLRRRCGGVGGGCTIVTHLLAPRDRYTLRA